MTSLSETLPILDQEVPALPTKVEAVAKEADAFDQAAHEALAAFEQKRQEAEALVDQVRQALTALHDQASEEQQRVEESVKALHQAAADAAQAVDAEAGELEGAGDQAATAFGDLETHLVQAGERTHAAQEEAHHALEALQQQAHTSQPELEGAVDEMTAAVHAAQQAVTDGHQRVAEAVARLGQTHQHLEELRDEQEKAVGEALSALETRRQQVEHDVTHHLDDALKQAVAPELDQVVDALADAGHKVMQLQTDTESKRTALEETLHEVAARVPPLQGGADQVKQTARTLGIAWP
jgi:chromosome segregation ATPase